MGPSDKLRDVATTLVDGCRKGQASANLDRLYADDAVSVEAYANPDMKMDREARGLEAIKGKHQWWESMFEEQIGDIPPEEAVKGPYYFGDDTFAVHFRMKIKNKETGEITEGSEIGTYHVKDGKIVREEFFYPM
ncbi:nuclear transport factor 2 family protein [Parvularcula lutaonensis]|uniref:SnoaL-like domain-containing protein n=1 Tax=Parvularcula lutaonensis TaxID=491923 RepID=A0ABV7M8G0_9PROT|nr:nuclear transport factor 2 family protein [Parvularcula lutaonensis]GGY44675.1 hypothetical protein GCM10007148_11980 [Parvularcula lutaonensis]